MTDPKTNVYDFGELLLEIISGKLPYSEEQGTLVNLVIWFTFSKSADIINVAWQVHLGSFFILLIKKNKKRIVLHMSDFVDLAGSRLFEW